MRQRIRCILLLSLIISSIFSFACSSNLPNSTLLKHFADKGPVAIDSNNPYLGGFQLLSQLKAQSKEISSLIDIKGNPSAIEVKTSFFSPSTIYFFYENYDQIFSIQKIPDGYLITEHGKNWGQERYSKNFHSKDNTSKIEQNENLNAELTPKDKLENNNQKDLIFLKELILRFASKEAEFSPDGDLVHIVQYPDETLNILTYWYTNDTNNSKKISRINAISPNKALRPKQKIIIPGYLVTNNKVLTEEALKAIIIKFK